MFDPETWATITEKLGIPFVTLLMGFISFLLIIKWIIKPLTESHVSTLNKIKEYTDSTITIRDKLVDNVSKLVDNQRQVIDTQKEIIATEKMISEFMSKGFEALKKCIDINVDDIKSKIDINADDIKEHIKINADDIKEHIKINTDGIKDHIKVNTEEIIKKIRDKIN